MGDPKVPVVSMRRSVLDAIVNWEKPYSPSLRDICEATGISSTSVVNYHIVELVRRGYVNKEPKLSRGISYTGKAINSKDFIQKKKGGRYGNKSGSVRRENEGAEIRATTEHEPARGLLDGNTSNLQSRRQHRTGYERHPARG